MGCEPHVATGLLPTGPPSDSQLTPTLTAWLGGELLG